MAITYEKFIDEVKALIEKIEGFNKEDLNAKSEAFKDWHLEICELIWQIRRVGYTVNCIVDTRPFYIREGYSPVSISQQENKFKKDLEDTLRELRLIIGHYSKFGEQELRSKTVKIQVPEEKNELEFPAKITLEWVGKHVPVDWYWKVGCILIVIIGFSFAAGRKYDSFVIPFLKPITTAPIQVESPVTSTQKDSRKQ